MLDCVRYEFDGAVASVVMDDGKVNAMSVAMLSALNAALDRAEADHAAVLLAGRPGVFSAGFNLSVLRAGRETSAPMVRMGFELAYRLLSFPAPVVVACTGHALAMGVFIVLAGDYRIGADETYRIGANEVAIGLRMPWLGVEMCRQRLAPSHFHRATINAEIYTPAGAVAAGFLDAVAPGVDVMAEARQVATALGGLDRSVYAETKFRERRQALEAVRAAIEADGAALAVG